MARASLLGRWQMPMSLDEILRMSNIFAVLGNLTRARSSRVFVSLLDSADRPPYHVVRASLHTHASQLRRLRIDKGRMRPKVGGLKFT